MLTPMKHRQALMVPEVPSVTASADPAANAEFSITVPAGELWLVEAVSVQMVQGLTQTPWPSLVVDDGTNILFQAFSGTAAQNASVTTQHSWGVGVPQGGSGASLYNTGPLPAGLVLKPGWRLRSITSGLGANSNYGPAQVLVTKLSNFF